LLRVPHPGAFFRPGWERRPSTHDRLFIFLFFFRERIFRLPLVLNVNFRLPLGGPGEAAKHISIPIPIATLHVVIPPITHPFVIPSKARNLLSAADGADSSPAEAGSE
jgi:hypothetical protein